MIKITHVKRFTLASAIVLVFGCGAGNASAQVSNSILYVPLIGITSVPEPLALPSGPGDVTYRYSVKNFIEHVPLINVLVIDDICGTVKFITGDDNGDLRLDFNETWRYSCTTKISTTTQSTATVTGTANNITATHKAYTTVVVGSRDLPPLVSIVNVSKIAYPLSLPSEGGNITFTYKVNNPGKVPLSKVTITDDKCGNMSGKLGDTNGNDLLDVNEVWIYTCTANLKETTTNTATVVAFANGLKAVSDTTITVTVDTPITQSVPESSSAGSVSNTKMIVWGILTGILVALILLFIFKRNNKGAKSRDVKEENINH